MKRSAVVQTTLICSTCGTPFTISRKTHRQKKLEHIKHMWCYRCRSVKPFVEYKDTDFAFKVCDYEQRGKLIGYTTALLGIYDTLTLRGTEYIIIDVAPVQRIYIVRPKPKEEAENGQVSQL